MKCELPRPFDGFTKDLPDLISTMSYADAECPGCGKHTICNSRRVFCHNCGVWWDIGRLVEIKDV